MAEKIRMFADDYFIDNLLRFRTRDECRQNLRKLYCCNLFDKQWLFATNGKVLAGMPTNPLTLQSGAEYRSELLKILKTAQ